MTGLGCLRARERIASRAGGLSDAERIELEEHLEDCAPCTAWSEHVDGLRELLGPPRAPVLGPRERDRALRRALAAPAAPVSVGRRPAWHRVGLVVAAAGICGAIAWVVLAPPEVRLVEAPAAPAAQAPQVSRTVATLQVARPAPPPTEPAVRETRVAHATIFEIEAAQWTWVEERATLVLESGSIDVRVDPALHRPFAVEVSGHRVEVVGTHFVVSMRELRVLEGIVRLLDAAGGETLLGAGETAPLSAQAVAVPRTEVSAAAVLRRARSELAAGHAVAALVLLAAIERRALGPHDRAELGTLRAECAVVQGDLVRAQSLYEAVAEDHDDLDAGENALFAAARLAARRGDARARPLFERYAARYPGGRFHDEVTRRLAQGRE